MTRSRSDEFTAPAEKDPVVSPGRRVSRGRHWCRAARRGRGETRRRGKTGPVTVAYIEVNDHSMLNAGKYTLANGGAQVIDVAVIFAANINYDGSNAYL